MKLGSTGPHVTQWEQILVAIEPEPPYRGKLDTTFGPACEASTKGLQRELGLPETGEVTAVLVLECIALLRGLLVQPERLAAALFGD